MSDATNVAHRAQDVQRLAQLGFPVPLAAAESTEDALTKVVQRYQRFHGLQATGELDHETLRSLYAPRFCGHPDVMELGEEASLPRWPDDGARDLTWAFTNLSAWPSVISQDLIVACFEAAWKAWSDQVNIKPRMVASTASALVRIESAPIDGRSSTLAWSELANNTMSPKQQRYDSAEQWYEKFLRLTAAHELGHVLGISHLSAGNLMAPTLNLNISGPQAGDLSEAVARYGRAVATPPPPPPPPPPPNGQSLEIRLGYHGTIDSISIPGFRVTKMS